jgi:hypothetical protein
MYVNVNCFLYFGVLVSIGEVHTAAKKVINGDDLYEFIYGHGLAFKRVGDAATGASLVVGRELFAQPRWTGVRVFTTADGQAEISSLNGTRVQTKLPPLEEAAVTKKLGALGLVRTPGYLLVQNHEIIKGK